jgi:hypothetical protein
VHVFVLPPSPASTYFFFTKFSATLGESWYMYIIGYYQNIVLAIWRKSYREIEVLFHFSLSIISIWSYLSPLLPSPGSISLLITKWDTVLQQIPLAVLAPFWLGQCPTKPSGSCLFQGVVCGFKTFTRSIYLVAVLYCYFLNWLVECLTSFIFIWCTKWSPLAKDLASFGGIMGAGTSWGTWSLGPLEQKTFCESKLLNAG